MMVPEPINKFDRKIIKICKCVCCFYDVLLPTISSQHYTYACVNNKML